MKACIFLLAIAIEACTSYSLLADDPILQSVQPKQLNNSQVQSTSLFDGLSFRGWEGDTKKTWRVENGSIVAGSLDSTTPRNEFLATTREFKNFELRLKYKLIGKEGFVNGGIQFRSQRIPNHHEVQGYQADFGMGFDGSLYDESRRNKVLASPSKEAVERLLKKDDWNEYRIRANNERIQLWLNNEQTVDYVEQDDNISQQGMIALQVHGNAKAIVQYREIEIRELGEESSSKSD